MFFVGFVFNLKGPLYRHHSFWLCVFRRFLCVQTQVSLYLLHEYIVLFLALFLLFVCFFHFSLFVFTLSYYYLYVCLFFNEKNKACGFWQKRRWGDSWRYWGRGNNDQHIVYEKFLFTIKGREINKTMNIKLRIKNIVRIHRNPITLQEMSFGRNFIFNVLYFIIWEKNLWNKREGMSDFLLLFPRDKFEKVKFLKIKKKL